MSLALQEVSVAEKKLVDYNSLIPDVVESLTTLAQKSKNLKIAEVNATALGGGVAEMLPSEVPLWRDLGLSCGWYVIPPDMAFFEVTKKIHNFLQGKAGDLTPQEKHLYLEHNKVCARLLDEIETDVLIVHDPQPAAAVAFMKNRPKLVIWRCHIDTSTPNEAVWSFIFDYLQKFDRFIFTMQDFVHDGIAGEKVSLITPVIDPFAPKNKLMTKDEAKLLLTSLGVDVTKPLVTQVSRLDPWKDPIGVIDACQLAKARVPNLQLAFVAQMASDDPEGVQIAEEVKAYAKSKEGILFFINMQDNDRFVDAFQTASDVILQKSIKEGFALTVTEAMWKGAIVIGGRVGGIQLQIQDGENGFLVNSVEEAAEKIVYVLANQDKMQSISQKAHESVKTRYLMPHLLLSYLKVFQIYF